MKLELVSFGFDKKHFTNVLPFHLLKIFHLFACIKRECAHASCVVEYLIFSNKKIHIFIEKFD